MKFILISNAIFNIYVILPSIIAGLLIFIVSFYLMKRDRYNTLIKCGETNSFYHGVNTGIQCGKYYDIDKVLHDKSHLDELTKWYVDNINEIRKTTNIDAIAFIEREDGPIGTLPLMQLISEKADVPSFVVRPRKRIHASAIKGINDLKGKNIAIISDVATSGFSIDKVTDIISALSAHVVAAITIVNRGGERVVNNFKEKKIIFRYVDNLR